MVHIDYTSGASVSSRVAGVAAGAGISVKSLHRSVEQQKWQTRVCKRKNMCY